MGNCLSKVAETLFELYKRIPKSRENGVSYNNLKAVYSYPPYIITTPVQDRFPLQACKLEYREKACRYAKRILPGKYL